MSASWKAGPLSKWWYSDPRVTASRSHRRVVVRPATPSSARIAIAAAK